MDKLQRIKSNTGFTIVELLIVVVVIGVLAAITVVAYNGIQQRAKNAQTITAAEQWEKLIKLYIAQNGYGTIRNGGHYCLGNGYPTDWDANSDEDCVGSGSIKHPLASINTTLAAVGSLPAATPVLEANSGSYRAGVSLRQADTLDPTGANIASYPTLWYYLDGNNQDCVLRPVVRIVSGGITIDPTATYTSIDGKTTICRIALPDPTSL